MKRPHAIPVIDLFAGPGGLGAGFSALTETPGTVPWLTLDLRPPT